MQGFFFFFGAERSELSDYSLKAVLFGTIKRVWLSNAN